MEARLEINDISRAFGGRRVVSDVCLRVDPGQVICLLGPSGCGKSTTLRIIAGVDRPDAGVIRIDGRAIAGPDVFVPPEKRGIGLMFQDFALFPHLSVFDNVAFGLTGSRTARRMRVRELLDKVGLLRYETRFPHELSGGEQQRVALARALAPRPRIMLMDEPFSGLDDRLRDGIRDETLAILKDEGAAVLLVTHEPEEAMRMADEIALMRGGRIVQQGAPYSLYNAPVDREAAAFFSDVNVIRGQVRDQRAGTVFGAFPVPGQPDGAEVELVVRPQHIRIDTDRAGEAPATDHGGWARARVERARFIGKESLVEVGVEADGAWLTATVPGVFLPDPGTPLRIALRRDRCFVFPVVPGEG